MASGASAASPKPSISASVESPIVHTGTVLAQGWKGLGQVSKGVLRIPLQLFTPRVRSSTPGDMVEGGFFSSDSPSLALSAADSALKSGS